MAIILNDNIKTNAPKPSDSRYFNGLNPWASVAEVNSSIVPTTRYRGLTVNIAWVEYRYEEGIDDTDLVEKKAKGTWTLVWDGSVPFSTFYLENEIASQNTGVFISLKWAWHSIDAWTYQNIKNLMLYSADPVTVDIEDNAELDNMPTLLYNVGIDVSTDLSNPALTVDSWNLSWYLWYNCSFNSISANPVIAVDAGQELNIKSNWATISWASSIDVSWVLNIEFTDNSVLSDNTIIGTGTLNALISPETSMGTQSCTTSIGRLWVAENVSYDNTDSWLVANEVKSAIDELSWMVAWWANPIPWDMSWDTDPSTTAGEAARWIITVAGTSPSVWAVEAWGWLLWNGSAFSYVDSPLNDYVNAGVNNVAVGGIGANEWPFNTTVQEMINRMLYPFSPMTASIGSWYTFEKGVEQAPITLNATFNKSQNPTYNVEEIVYKRGTSVLDTITGANLVSWDNPYTENDTIVDTTTFSADVTDAKPDTVSPAKTLSAIYPFFYGTDAWASAPAANQALIDSWNKLVQSSTGTIVVNFGNASDERLWFAIPATSPSKTKRYIDALNNGNIWAPTDLFDAENLVSVDSPDLYRNGIQYKIYVSTYKTTPTGAMQLRNS